jgi:hypothetical protein
VHQPVGVVFNSVNPTPGNDLPRSVAFRHSGPRSLRCTARYSKG